MDSITSAMTRGKAETLAAMEARLEKLTAECIQLGERLMKVAELIEARDSGDTVVLEVSVRGVFTNYRLKNSGYVMEALIESLIKGTLEDYTELMKDLERGIKPEDLSEPEEEDD